MPPGARAGDVSDPEGQAVVFRDDGASRRGQPEQDHPRGAATAANVHDATVLPDLLHGEETRVWGDQAYQGQGEVIREQAPAATNFTNRRIRRREVVNEAVRARNRTKSKVRAKVEHSLGVIKRVFGFSKMRYRGLAKNPIACLSPAPWPICSSPAASCAGSRGCSAPAGATNTARQGERLAQVTVADARAETWMRWVQKSPAKFARQSEVP
jgi:hypothetical protein